MIQQIVNTENQPDKNTKVLIMGSGCHPALQWEVKCMS